MSCVVRETISNPFGQLTLIPEFNENSILTSKRRSMDYFVGLDSIQVYAISFVKEEYNMVNVTDKSLDLFVTLFKHFENKF